jgi:hypothetical protein
VRRSSAAMPEHGPGGDQVGVNPGGSPAVPGGCLQGQLPGGHDRVAVDVVARRLDRRAGGGIELAQRPAPGTRRAGHVGPAESGHEPGQVAGGLALVVYQFVGVR